MPQRGIPIETQKTSLLFDDDWRCRLLGFFLHARREIEDHEFERLFLGQKADGSAASGERHRLIRDVVRLAAAGARVSATAAALIHVQIREYDAAARLRRRVSIFH